MTTATSQMLSEQEVNRQAEREGLDETRDVVESLELRLQELRTGAQDPAGATLLLKQDVSNLRLKVRAVPIPGLGAVTHRLDDYLSGLAVIEAQHIGDLQAFSDRIAALLDGEPVSQEMEHVAMI